MGLQQSTFHYPRSLEHLDGKNPKPSFPYPKHHTIFFKYLGRYVPEPNWNRWLSPFRQLTLQNAFSRGISVIIKSPHPPVFFPELSKAVQRKLSRGYKVAVLTPHQKLYTKVTVKYTKAKGSYSMTFEHGDDYWESRRFDRGETILDFWILLEEGSDQLPKKKKKKDTINFQKKKKRPDQRPDQAKSITFLIQERRYTQFEDLRVRFHSFRRDQLDLLVKHFWSKLSEAVDKYNKKYQEKYQTPLPQQIINEFHANFRYNILVPFRRRLYYKLRLDDWGFDTKFCGFDINDNQQQFDPCASNWPRKIVRDPEFGDSYTKTLQKFQMIGSDLAIKPWAISIWMTLQNFLNSKFKEIKVEDWDVRFHNPAEQDDFLEGNAPKVAIDPTIETTTYSVFLETIRELPFKLNRWCQVVRRESNPIPLIRCCEFPYQQAYSAFATKMEADEEILEILELYRQLFEEFFAVPVIKCKAHSFADNYTVEAFLSYLVWSGTHGGYRDQSYSLEGGAFSVRGATAHCLGQNVTESLNENGEKVTTWLNSWSCSIRVIGLMVMVHGNADGLVLPPKVAPTQVIVTSRVKIDSEIREACNCIVDTLCEAGIRAGADLDNFPTSRSCWEDKGVPLLIKVGPEVLNFKQVLVHHRDSKHTYSIPMTSMVEKVNEILDEIQESLFKAAKQRQDACIQTVHNWDAFVKAVHNMKIMLTPWCDEEVVEKYVKAQIGLQPNGYGVEILCSPLEQPAIFEDTKCFASGKPAKKWIYWGRKFLD